MTAYALAAATAIFVVTYALISFRRLGVHTLDRPAAALLGGALMLIFGILTPAQALASINLDVVLLLVGMMLLVSGLEVCGFFDFISGPRVTWSSCRSRPATGSRSRWASS